jgi:hypothetical protein
MLGPRHRMITVIVHTLNAEAALPATLAALVPATVDGLVRQVLIADGGSLDRTAAIADATGADLLRGPADAGALCALGATHARFAWLLFVAPGTSLAQGWEQAVGEALDRCDLDRTDAQAFTFKRHWDQQGVTARVKGGLARLRAGVLKRPQLEDGLLISRRFYRDLGGHRAVASPGSDLARRIGRGRLQILNAAMIVRRSAILARAAPLHTPAVKQLKSLP